MAVRIGGIVHSTPVTLETTRCGLPYDKQGRFKSSDITCEPCRQGARQSFLSGWGDWLATRTPEELRRMSEEEERERGETD